MSEPSRQALLGHYELEGNFNESTGTYRHGRYLGLAPTPSDGPVGQAATLDSGAHIEVPAPQQWNADRPFSLAFWFRGGNKLEPMTILKQGERAGLEIGNDEVFSIGDLRRGAHLLLKLTGGQIRSLPQWSSLPAPPREGRTARQLPHPGTFRVLEDDWIL
jgi:hypothetical protein